MFPQSAFRIPNPALVVEQKKTSLGENPKRSGFLKNMFQLKQRPTGQPVHSAAKPTKSTTMEKSFCALLFYQSTQCRRPRLPFLYLLRRKILSESGNHFAEYLDSICFCQEKSSVGLNEILRHAFASKIHHAKVVLRLGIPLLGRLSKPLYRFT